MGIEFPKKGSSFYRSFFFMAAVNANTVKRSNAINGYGPNVKYTEGTAFKSFFGALFYVLGYMLYGIGMYVAPLRYLMRTFYLPKPGEGPSEEFMNAGYLHITGIAKGNKGTIVESALSLSLQGDKVKRGGGVLTPASCQKEVLLERLLVTGTSFEYH